MTRPVVIEGTIIGNPVYVASDEADAARWISNKQKELESKGKSCTRLNSLTLELNYGSFDKYHVVTCPTWE